MGLKNPAGVGLCVYKNMIKLKNNKKLDLAILIFLLILLASILVYIKFRMPIIFNTGLEVIKVGVKIIYQNLIWFIILIILVIIYKYAKRK